MHTRPCRFFPFHEAGLLNEGSSTPMPMPHTGSGGVASQSSAEPVAMSIDPSAGLARNFSRTP